MIAELVSVIQSTVPSRIRSTIDVGQRLGVGVVVDGDLVDIGQLLELVLEERSAAIGAGQQDLAARGHAARGPRPAPRSDRIRARDRRAGDSRRGPPPSSDRSPRASDGPGPAGRGLALRAAEEEPNAVGRREDQPVVVVQAIDRRVERRRVGDRA